MKLEKKMIKVATNSMILSVNVDKSDKEKATKILNDLGLNMTTYINAAIKQLIKHNGVPFEIKNPKPSRQLKQALKELKYMEEHLDEYPMITNREELERELLSDD